MCISVNAWSTGVQRDQRRPCVLWIQSGRQCEPLDLGVGIKPGFFVRATSAVDP